MITFYVLSAVTAILVVLGWILVASMRSRPRPIVEVIDRTETSLAAKLGPHVELRESACYDDEKLWGDIGRLRGLRVIYREAGAIATAGVKIGHDSSLAAGELASFLVVGAGYLRGMVFLCMLEAIVKTALPCVPRIQARSLARLYCDIASSLDVARSMCEPYAASVSLAT